jgi:hypothetical protein
MASPNFAIAEASSGFIAVNERPSPTNSSSRPIDPAPSQQKEAWPNTNGDANSQSLQLASLPTKRRFEDVEPGSDDRQHTNGTSPNTPERNGTQPHINGTNNDHSFTQPGASRGPNWNVPMDDSRIAQLLTESNSRTDDSPSQAASKTDAPIAAEIANSDMITTHAGLQYDKKKRKRVSSLHFAEVYKSDNLGFHKPYKDWMHYLQKTKEEV